MQIHSTVSSDLFEVCRLIEAGWFMFRVCKNPHEHVLMTNWLSAAGEDVVMFEELEEEGMEEEDVQAVVLFQDQKRAAQFGLMWV